MKEEFKATYDKRTGKWSNPRYTQEYREREAQRRAARGRGTIGEAVEDMMSAYTEQEAGVPGRVVVAPSRIIDGERVFSITTCGRWEPGENTQADRDPQE